MMVIGTWIHPHSATIAFVLPDLGKSVKSLGWECCRHVGDMSAEQPNVGTFGRHAPVMATQIGSRHHIFVLVIANIHQIFSEYQS